MNDIGEYQFEIKDAGNFIRIIPQSFMHPEAEMGWDRNWIETFIEINASPFRGKYKTSLRSGDFEIWKQELKQIYDDLAGRIMFDSLEGEIEIKIKGDGLGHFKANCKATDRTTVDGCELSFVLDFDQTQIPELIRQLEEITIAFPPSVSGL